MASSATLATMRARLKNALMDAALAVWAQDAQDEALRLALDEYTRAFPRQVMGTVTPASTAREVSISTLNGLSRVLAVWYPYLSTDPMTPCKFVYNEAAGTIWLDTMTAPDGVKVARVLYEVPHTLKDLDSAAATTYANGDDGILIMGAVGHACEMRAIDDSEGDLKDTSTPNLMVIGTRILRQFRIYLSEVR